MIFFVNDAGECGRDDLFQDIFKETLWGWIHWKEINQSDVVKLRCKTMDSILNQWREEWIS